MLATITRMADADYYLGLTESLHQATDYYTGGLEPDGVWFNPGGHLGIEHGGTVGATDFKALFHGFSPDGEALTQNAGKKERVSGLDITFSADKSISSYWAIASDEERKIIEETLQESVFESVQYLNEEGSFSRRGHDGEIQEKCDFIAGTFLHCTSRDLDPQLHIHTTIMNVSFRQDGTTGALDQPGIYQKYKSLGAIATYKACRKLHQKLGLNFESHGRNNEFRGIKDFPQDLVKLWSKRRQAILRRANELGLEGGSNSIAMGTIAVATRLTKNQDNTREQLLERFTEEALELGYDIGVIQNLIAKEMSFSEEEVWEKLCSIPNRLLKNEAIFKHDTLVDEVYRAVDIQMPEERVKELFDELKVARGLIYLGESKVRQKIYTTPEMIFSEMDVKRLTRQLGRNIGHKISYQVAEERLAELKLGNVLLSVEQIEAFRGATVRSGAISIIEGAAGSGKSMVLSAISGLFNSQGFEVIGASTMWRVANSLGQDCEIDSFAIDKLLFDIKEGRREISKKTVLIIDEAGTLSTNKMKELLAVGDAAGSKVILVGDREQQQAVEAGSGLRLSADICGTDRIDRIRRQKATVEDILIYKDKTGTLDRRTARLQEGMMGEEQRAALLKSYSETVERRGEVWQRTASGFFKEGECFKGLDEYYERGRVHFGKNHGSVIWKLANDYVNWTGKNPEESVAIQARTNKEASEITHAVRKILRQSGRIGEEEYSIKVAGKKKGETEEIFLSKGDRFKFGGKNKDLGVVNGTEAVVTNIVRDRKGLVITADISGREVSFRPKEMKGFDKLIQMKSGYVTTIYATQGTTVDTSFSLVDHNLMRENAYSVATRHKHDCHFYFNRELAEEFVLGQRSEASRELPVKEKEILEMIGAKWSVSAQKELAHDHMDAQTLDHYRELYALQEQGVSISTSVSQDIVAREAGRLEELKAMTFTGEDLEARKRVGVFALRRAEAAVLGEKMRESLGEDGVFYEHPDYPKYQELRARADAAAALIAEDIGIHRGGLANYPNVTDDQLLAAKDRFEARELVGSWRKALSAGRVATADRLAAQIIGVTTSEKTDTSKASGGTSSGEPSKKYMTAAVREQGRGVWDYLYRGAEDHRERIVREGLSAQQCADRDVVLDYRRSSITVGRIYGELQSLAGDGQQISEQPGYAKLQTALAARDRLAFEARSVSAEIRDSFAVKPEKIERQAAIGEARQLLNSYRLQDAKGSVSERDRLAAEIILRTKAEKGMALELEAMEPTGNHRLEKVTGRVAMEKAMDWKRLFAQANAHEERQYLGGLSPAEQSLHAQVKRYRELEREVGKYFRTAKEESKEQLMSKEDTPAWAEMQALGAKRDRLAHTLVAGRQNLGRAMKHYRGNTEKLEARADGVTAADLVDSYLGYKLEGKNLNAGQVAGEILARMSVEKLDRKPKVTAREIYARETGWNDLYDDRKVFVERLEQAVEVFGKAYPDDKNNLDFYMGETDKLVGTNARIIQSAKEHGRLEIDHNAYADWHRKRKHIHEFGQKIVSRHNDLSPFVRYHYKDVVSRIYADIKEYSHIDRRHEKQTEHVVQRHEEKQAELKAAEEAAKKELDKAIDDEDTGIYYSYEL